VTSQGRELPSLTAESAATIRSVVKSTIEAGVLAKADKVELFNNTLGGLPDLVCGQIYFSIRFSLIAAKGS